MTKQCDQFLWTEKFRPKTVRDTILPDHIKEPFLQFVKQGNVPNLTLAGSPGTGKTTIALAALEEIGADVYKINGSLNADKGTLKTEIAAFASTMSMTGGRKYVIIDEADYLHLQNVQTGLRSFIEECADNCGFILTCNYPNRLMDAIRSRCPVIEFKILNKDKPKLATAFLKRMTEILDSEQVEYDKEALVEIIKQYMPDWRKTLNKLQFFAARGKITIDNVMSFDEAQIKKLVDFMKKKDWTAVKKWMSANPDVDQDSLFSLLSEHLQKYLSPAGDALATVLIAKYQDMGKGIPNPTINMRGCLAELMIEADWHD